MIISVIALVLSFILLIVGFVGAGNSAMDNFNSFGENNGINVDVSGVQNTASGIVMFIAHRREITAYTSQQVMSLAQKWIEKMASTVGNAMRTIVKELAKNMKQGINEANKE